MARVSEIFKYFKFLFLRRKNVEGSWSWSWGRQLALWQLAVDSLQMEFANRNEFAFED